jgi:sulfotransferase family protein
MTEQPHNLEAGESRRMVGTRKKPTSAWRKFRRKLSKTRLRKPHIWLRHRGIGEADTFFASYPRSGTTWSRFTLYEILTGQEASFHAVNAALRGVGRHAMGLQVLPGNGRLISTHEQYRKEYKRAIYLVRDARDVALSEFAYTTALEFFRGNLDEFLETFLCKKISPFGPWQRHVTSWLDSPIAGTANLSVFRYEDLRQNPFEGFTRMAEFLGVEVDAERIRRAIANNSLDKMKEKERVEPQRASVKDRFVRSGSVQGWRSKLSSAQVEFIEKHAGGALSRLGYPVSSVAAVTGMDVQPVLQSTTHIS